MVKNGAGNTASRETIASKEATPMTQNMTITEMKRARVAATRTKKEIEYDMDNRIAFIMHPVPQAEARRRNRAE